MSDQPISFRLNGPSVQTGNKLECTEGPFLNQARMHRGAILAYLLCSLGWGAILSGQTWLVKIVNFKKIEAKNWDLKAKLSFE